MLLVLKSRDRMIAVTGTHVLTSIPGTVRFRRLMVQKHLNPAKWPAGWRKTAGIPF